MKDDFIQEHENQENDFTDFLASAGVVTGVLMAIFVVVTIVELLVK
jgi:hypothetical protein